MPSSEFEIPASWPPLLEHLFSFLLLLRGERRPPLLALKVELLVLLLLLARELLPLVALALDLVDILLLDRGLEVHDRGSLHLALLADRLLVILGELLLAMVYRD